MNKHIELVKRWLDDPDSVTTEELKANADTAWAAWTDDDAAFAAVAYFASADSANAAAAYDANAYAAVAYYADAANAAVNSAAKHVKRYEELLEDKGNE